MPISANNFMLYLKISLCKKSTKAQNAYLHNDTMLIRRNIIMFLVMILLAVLGVLSIIFSVFGFKSNKKY